MLWGNPRVEHKLEGLILGIDKVDECSAEKGFSSLKEEDRSATYKYYNNSVISKAQGRDPSECQVGQQQPRELDEKCLGGAPLEHFLLCQTHNVDCKFLVEYEASYPLIS
jgi:hypothetical protein